MKVRRLERSLRAYGIVAGEVSGFVLFFALLIYSGNAYLAGFGALVIMTIIIVTITRHIHRKTGRWWFIPTKHFPIESPRYDTPLVDFLRSVESQIEE